MNNTITYNTVKQYAYIDITKFIMAIFVTAIHATPLNIFEGTMIISLFNAVSRTAVPFFFVASGYFSGGVQNALKFKSYTFRIIKLYLQWTLIYLPLAVYGYLESEISAKKAVILYFINLFFRGEHYDSWHLWYLLSLIYSLILIYILSRKINFKWILLISSLIMLCGISIDYIYALYPNSTAYLKIILISGRTMTGILPVTVGIYIRENKIILNKYVIIFSSILYVFLKLIPLKIPILLSEDKPDILNYIFGIMVFIFIKQIDELKFHQVKLHTVFRNLSTSIYFIHMYFIFIYQYFWGNSSEYNHLYMFIFALSCSISVSIIWFIISPKIKSNKIIKNFI